MRFVGEPIAAVLATTREEAEDIAERVEVEIEQTPPVVDARAGIAPGAATVHAEAPGNVIVEGRVKTPGFDAKVCGAQRGVSKSTSARGGRMRCRSSRAPRMPPGTRRAGA